MGNPLERLDNIYRNRSRLVKVAFFITSNLDDAEEVVQDAFLSLLESNGGIPEKIDDKDVKWYVYKVVRDKAIDGLRRKIRDQSRYNSAYLERLGDRNSSPIEMAICSEIKSYVDNKEGILRYILDGKSYDEIAKERSMPKGSVSNRLFREREKLRFIYN